ncbi:hypothetical protein [Oceanobacillus rekensis]|uniref:hypothetical protein n=1 Tax=Oceanobacillus rekensis TaxID=937927 RepID=UPI001FE415BC|nr:hypothetical protein [Oceanobacillus rekensis]
MEKGMTQARHVNYEEYGRRLETRMKIEKQRDEEYKEAKMLTSEFDSQLPK